MQRSTTATSTDKNSASSVNQASQTWISRHPQLSPWSYSCGSNRARDANGYGKKDSAHNQSHCPLSRHSQQITDTKNTGDSRHPGRTDQSIRKCHLPNACPTSPIPNTTNPGDASKHGRTEHYHGYLLSLTRTAQSFSNSTNPAKHDFNRHLAVLSGTHQSQLRRTALA